MLFFLMEHNFKKCSMISKVYIPSEKKKCISFYVFKFFWTITIILVKIFSNSIKDHVPGLQSARELMLFLWGVFFLYLVCIFILLNNFFLLDSWDACRHRFFSILNVDIFDKLSSISKPDSKVKVPFKIISATKIQKVKKEQYRDAPQLSISNK